MVTKIKYIKPIEYKSAQGLVAEVYEQIVQIKNNNKVGKPYIIHSPLPKLLAGFWCLMREVKILGKIKPTIKEAMIVAESKLNECPHCANSHASALGRLSGTEVFARVILGNQGNYEGIPNPQMRSLVVWAKANLSPKSDILLSPPFSQQEAPEIIGTAFLCHYINRMVNLYLDTSEAKYNNSSNNSSSMIRNLKKFSSNLKPGESLNLLPDAALPDDFSWAESNPFVAGAFARFAVSVEEAGNSAISEPVRKLVGDYIQGWNGQKPPLSRHWVEEAIEELDEVSKSAARLALLTALASYQVDKEVVNAFRLHYPGDEKLLGVTTWASFTAARRVATWLDVPG